MSAAPASAWGSRAARYGTIGAVLGFFGVLAGAFGAHALKARLSPVLLQVFETAVRYQLVHALALVVAALALERGGSRPLAAACVLFVAGTVCFSGSLYALALTGVPAWGMVTPVGGVCLLGGWVALAAGLARRGAGA
jgi:uncharacterized membrane protein YgdD (TMEM256/DUF423 family)